MPLIFKYRSSATYQFFLREQYQDAKMNTGKHSFRYQCKVALHLPYEHMGCKTIHFRR